MASWIPCLPVGESGELWRWIEHPDEQNMVWPSIDKLVMGTNSRVTGIDEIWHAAPTKPPVLVFQVSHCGSTLLARSFACLRTCFVAGEPTCTSFLINDYLSSRMPKDIFTRTLVGLVGHLDAAAGDRRLIIKFFSPASILAPLIMEAFPGAPAICMVRDPIEVLIGLRDKEMQAFFAPHLANLDPLVMSDMTWAGVCAAIIRRKLEGLLQVARRGARVLSYPTWCNMKSIRATIGELAVRSTDADFKAIQDILGKDAKNISVSFQPDGEAKKKSASQLILRESESLYPLHTELKG